tara:strand:+ start:1029 stop:1391 length:363 start_codon:yes stop_codon:yes gene_type:complete
MSKAVGGRIEIKVDGQLFSGKGAFDYEVSGVKRESVVGHDAIHGYKEMPKVPYIEGTITDSPELSLERLSNMTGVTVTLSLINGKSIVLNDAWYTGDAKGNSEEGEIDFRFEGLYGQEIS